MELRLTQENEAETVLALLEQGKETLRSRGIPQWQEGYPDRDSVLTDIALNQSYVLVDNDSIVGSAALVLGIEETYQIIYEGEWFDDQPYISIHRLVVDATKLHRGLATELLQNIETIARLQGIYSLRIDTHQLNKAMDRLLMRSGFQARGMIQLLDLTWRKAYDKQL